LGGVLLHVADPLAPSLELVASIAANRAPSTRVISVRARSDAPYQVHVADLQGVCEQFGFPKVELAGEELGCIIATLFAAWFPTLVTRLTLYAPAYGTESDGLFGRSLRDCPPDWPRLRAALACPVDVLG
jgi:pimeloyl-ACP methyl ester carboxylesterase